MRSGFAPNATITDFGKALWWSFVTVTTVGYGDLSPVTWQGKCIAVGLMITGIALIGVVTATLASWIVDRVDSETTKRAKESDNEIKQLAGQCHATVRNRLAAARRTPCGTPADECRRHDDPDEVTACVFSCNGFERRRSRYSTN